MGAHRAKRGLSTRCLDHLAGDRGGPRKKSTTSPLQSISITSWSRGVREPITAQPASSALN